MRTIPGGSQRGVARGKLLMNPLRQVQQLGLGILATGNTRLIGDNDQSMLGNGCATAEFKNSRHPVDLVRRVHITEVDIYHAITIQKNGRPSAQIYGLVYVTTNTVLDHFSQL